MNARRKSAIVTGGAQGIGKITVLALLEKGWNVTFVDIDEEAGSETLEGIRAVGLGDFCRFLPGDVADEAVAVRAAETAAAEFGSLNGLVNDAAVSANKPVTELSLREWNRVLAVNLTGAFLFVKHAAAALAASKGAVVNIASSRALMSEPGTEAYSASKGGVVALTHALAVSLGPSVRVNCVSPGWIDVTPHGKRSVRVPEQLRPEDHAQHPAGRVGKPEDVASMAVYLLGEESGFITGQNFIVDGGMTKKMVYV